MVLPEHKLTKPQLALLCDIAQRPRYVVDSYPPAQALVRTGLAYWGHGRFCGWLVPSGAGIAAARGHSSPLPVSQPIREDQ